MRKFTLLELLVVCAIIGILVSILMPSLVKAREIAKRAVCASNQKQIHTASIIYSIDNNSQFPRKMPIHNWPFGHYNSTESIPEDGELISLKEVGVNALVNSELITAYGVFYCPSNNSHFVKKRQFINRIKPGSTLNWYIHYSFWAGYSRALAIDDKISTDVSSDSDTMFMSEMIGNSGGDHYPSRHILNGITAGGNITFNDGAVKWRHYSKMQYRYSHGFDFWW